jgi:hypothetical protein
MGGVPGVCVYISSYEACKEHLQQVCVCVCVCVLCMYVCVVYVCVCWGVCVYLLLRGVQRAPAAGMYHNNRHNYTQLYTIILHIHTNDAYTYDTYTPLSTA